MDTPAKRRISSADGSTDGVIGVSGHGGRNRRPRSEGCWSVRFERMILTCPECATSYFVDDLRIPRGGRMVKCTTCGNRWRAFQDRSLPEREVPEEEMLVEAPRAPPA